MARARVKGRKVDRWKTKKKYRIVAPESFGNKEIGVTFASDEASLIGRTITVSLSELDGEYAKAHYRIKFRIIKATESEAKTEFAGQYIVQEYIRSLVRKRSTRVDAVVDVMTKDNLRVRLKFLAIGLSRMQKMQRTAIRKKLEELAKENAGKRTFDELMKELIFGRLLSAMHRDCNKFYPLKKLELRATELL